MVNLAEQWQLRFFEVWSKSSPAATSEKVISSTFKKTMRRKTRVHRSVSEICSVAPKDSNRPFINSHYGRFLHLRGACGFEFVNRHTAASKCRIRLMICRYSCRHIQSLHPIKNDQWSNESFRGQWVSYGQFDWAERNSNALLATALVLQGFQQIVGMFSWLTALVSRIRSCTSFLLSCSGNSPLTKSLSTMWSNLLQQARRFWQFDRAYKIKASSGKDLLCLRTHQRKTRTMQKTWDYIFFPVSGLHKRNNPRPR